MQLDNKWHNLPRVKRRGQVLNLSPASDRKYRKKLSI